MKITLRFLLTIVFCYSTLCIYADNQWISIINKNNDSKEEIISQLLAIQKSLIVPVNNIPEAYQQTGFLLVPMTQEYILSLLENKEGQIICSFMDQALVGYVILTEASEFKELYQDPVAGYFEMIVDSPNLNVWLSDNDVGYIEQIGVKFGYSRLGIGTQLIEAGKQIKPHGLISDVFIYPIVNTPSLHFFSSQGFKSPGVLYQFPKANANFPYEHRTQVFFWNGIN
jgi:ribosomal protein S18 acetylase RimI-like enzyme